MEESRAVRSLSWLGYTLSTLLFSSLAVRPHAPAKDYLAAFHRRNTPQKNEPTMVEAVSSALLAAASALYFCSEVGLCKPCVDALDDDVSYPIHDSWVREDGTDGPANCFGERSGRQSGPHANQRRNGQWESGSTGGEGDAGCEGDAG